MMNLEKLNPWNWFKHENGDQPGQQQIPVTRREAGALAPSYSSQPLPRIHQLFDEVFNAFGFPSANPGFNNRGYSSAGLSSVYRPQIDVAGDTTCYEISLDLPGISRDDLSIEVKGKLLTIKGQKEDKKEEKDRQFYRIERSYGSFQRTLSLPDDADTDSIDAKLGDGVLRLAIARHAGAQKDVKRIPISS